MNLLRLLEEKVRAVLQQYASDPGPYLAMVKPAQDSRHGDYQANFAMPLAKTLSRNPRDLAREIVQQLSAANVLDRAEVAGPGFINFQFHTGWLAEQIRLMAGDDRLGIPRADPPRTLVIDFSSPNVAKPLHVGHLRSTIIGDCLARLFRFLGHRIVTDNHLGDWGTQFGILLYGYKHFRDDEAMRADPVRELARLYLHVRGLMQSEEDENDEHIANPVADAARQETARLHAGDPENLRLWQMFLPWCRQEIDRIYLQLDVKFDQTLGESFYNPMLPEVVRSLEQQGLARASQGALVIDFGDDQLPAMIRKKDGAFTYTTTDLATIRYRVEQWHPDAILYVVDSRQALHFKNLFESARRWGYTGVALEHVAFGSVLGDNRKPLKTREGGAVQLEELLREAIDRGGQTYEQSRDERIRLGKAVPVLDEVEKQTIARVVGLGAVKYADLSQNRTSDYVFNWDKMLATDGNTATYMQYAYARNRSIFREGNESETTYRTDPPPVFLKQPQERALALQLLRFAEALESAATDYRPSAITSYLWDLAKSFSGFYQNCPVLKAEAPDLRSSRLLLCDLTARVIQQGLDLLGIRTVERM
jgi:arginyl-tRNA synthetase